MRKMLYLIACIGVFSSVTCSSTDAQSGDASPLKLLWTVNMNGGAPTGEGQPNFSDFLVYDTGVVVPYTEGGWIGLAMLDVRDGHIRWKYHQGEAFSRGIRNVDVGGMSSLGEQRMLCFSTTCRLLVCSAEDGRLLYDNRDFRPTCIGLNFRPQSYQVLYANPNSYVLDQGNRPPSYIDTMYAYAMNGDGSYTQGGLAFSFEQYKDYPYHVLVDYREWEEGGEKFRFMTHSAEVQSMPWSGEGGVSLISLYNITRQVYVYKDVVLSRAGSIIDKVGDVIYTTYGFTNDYFGVTAIDVKAGRSLWIWDRPKDEIFCPDWDNVVLLHGKIYFQGLDDLHCIDAGSGQRLWKVPIGGNVAGRIRYVNGVLYYTSPGSFWAFDAETGKQYFRLRVPLDAYNMDAIGVYESPVGSGEKARLIVCDKKNVYCYEALR